LFLGCEKKALAFGREKDYVEGRDSKKGMRRIEHQ